MARTPMAARYPSDLPFDEVQPYCSIEVRTSCFSLVFRYVLVHVSLQPTALLRH